MVICPGIGNHSEKHYIRTFVDHAQKDGYRCAVLNHLGALPNIELTSPRIFTYGKTKEQPYLFFLCFFFFFFFFNYSGRTSISVFKSKKQ